LAKALRTKKAEAQDCYQAALSVSQKVWGFVALTFDIKRNGRADKAHVDPRLTSLGAAADCITKAVQTWQFPTELRDLRDLGAVWFLTPDGVLVGVPSRDKV
jgi:hypothetical protein